MSTAHHLLPDAAEFARMETELFSRLERSHTRQVRRHRLVAVGAVVLLAGGGVAGVTVANTTSQTHLAYCYSGADTSSRNIGVLAAIDEGEKGGSAATQTVAARIANATARCGAIWEAGMFSAPNSNPAPNTIPLLQPCIRNDQVIAIFPKVIADETATLFCGDLGMSAP